MTLRLIDRTSSLWQKIRMLAMLVLFISALFFFIIMSLRYGKAISPLRRVEDTPLPGFPGPVGLVCRLDGIDRHQREITSGKAPSIKEDGGIILPSKWEEKVTAGRLACVAHTWALAQMAETDPEGAKAREKAVKRAHIITFFTLLIALALVFIKHMDYRMASALVAGIWTFMSFSAIPTQYREWKATDIARKGLKNAGLWPHLNNDAAALETCLKAMPWCRVAGFRRILPR